MTLLPPPLPNASATVWLKLMRLASPALPVGGFSYSEGLESAIEAGCVRDADSAGQWLLDQLHLVQQRCELPTMVQAHRAWACGDMRRVAQLNDWVLLTRETGELRLQAEQMGRSMALWLQQDAEDGDDPRVTTLKTLGPAPTWPVAFALATVLVHADARQAAWAMAFGWAENLVQAALKAIPLGQRAGQRVLDELLQAIPDAVEAALCLSDEERQTHSPMLAILGAHHEQQYSRLFRS